MNKRPLKNHEIKSHQVRLVNSDNSIELLSLEVALSIAQERGLDLIQVSQGDYPVCKIESFHNVFKKKKMKHQSRTSLKGMNFRPGIGEHDFNVKMKQVISFLQKGNSVRVQLRFKGRENLHKEQGEALFSKIAEQIAEVGVIDKKTTGDGRQWFLQINPRKNN